MSSHAHYFYILLNDKQKEFIEFVLSKYIETGVEELDQEKLPILLTNKYHSLEDAKAILGNVASCSLNSSSIYTNKTWRNGIDSPWYSHSPRGEVSTPGTPLSAVAWIPLD